MPTPPWSDLAGLLGDRVVDAAPDRLAVARDSWPLALARARAGDVVRTPDVVVRPESVSDVRTAVAWCCDQGVSVVAVGGGSGVCGGVAFEDGERPAAALDLRTLRGVESVDEHNLRATVLAGTLGSDYEGVLNPLGLTGGHYPQSLEFSTVGGWLSCRSSGQASAGFGRAEDLVKGLDVVLASGDVVSFAAVPGTAAGPDLGRLFLGSEGTLGVIVRATMLVRPAPERWELRAFGFADFLEALDVMRRLTRDDACPPIMRLYDEADALWNFSSAGPVLVCAGAPMPAGIGTDLGEGPARAWWDKRYGGLSSLRLIHSREGPLGPYGTADTVEVAAAWSDLPALYEAVRTALQSRADAVMCHASHVYPDGACLYFTFALAASDDAEASARYTAAWADAMAATVECGGTITHHHGVGRLKAAWLRAELGESGWRLLEHVKHTLDPKRILNPGNLGL